jgi:hypothetical protein
MYGSTWVKRSRDHDAVDGVTSGLSFRDASLPTHVYLSNLGVDDQMQGTGFRAALMRSCDVACPHSNIGHP